MRMGLSADEGVVARWPRIVLNGLRVLDAVVPAERISWK